MPHFTLEYSANIFEKKEFITLFKRCHEALAEWLPTQIESCKSRAVERSLYHIGAGEEDKAFVHVKLEVMPGRSAETLENTGKKLLEILKEYFVVSTQTLNLQITLEIKELEKTYFKVTRR